MRHPICLSVLSLLLAACGQLRATELNAAVLRAYAASPWDKATMMHTKVTVGTWRGVPVIAEFPCSDVCPEYTRRIIHLDLPEGMPCDAAGGVAKDVLVPVAIAVMNKRFCIPEPLLAGDRYLDLGQKH